MGGQILVKDSASKIKNLKQLDRMTEGRGEYNMHISAAWLESAHTVPTFT